jgi:hypothetical protein
LEACPGEGRLSDENNQLKALVRGDEAIPFCHRSQFPPMPRHGDMVSWPSRPDRKQMAVYSVTPEAQSGVELVLTV